MFKLHFVRRADEERIPARRASFEVALSGTFFNLECGDLRRFGIFSRCAGSPVKAEKKYQSGEDRRTPKPESVNGSRDFSGGRRLLLYSTGRMACDVGVVGEMPPRGRA